MVEYHVEGFFCHLYINNYPVNALSHSVRSGILGGIERATKDSNIRVIIISGRGKTFSSGADIKEFSSGDFYKSPSLIELCEALETCPKPVIAAIHGYALGGGLEVAISCHYRVMHSSSRLGLPEIKIGILPAASGTQRLPRLCGLELALDVIANNRELSSDLALKYGVVDRISDQVVENEAKAFASTILAVPLHKRMTSRQHVRDRANVDQLYNSAVKRAKKRYKGMKAPLLAIEATRASVDLPFEQGMKKEQECFLQLFDSSQARALQYAFLAQRMASKWSTPDGANYNNTASLSKGIKHVGIVGAGTMGSAIAVCFLMHGYNVYLVEQNQKFLENGLNQIKKIFSESVVRKKLTENQVSAFFKQLSYSVNMGSLRSVNMVVEAVYEDLELKKEIFKQLDIICKKDTILCTNTSYLDIDKLAKVTNRSDLIIGAHFFAPAHLMPLLEVVRGRNTSPTTISTIMNIGTRIKKTPVLVANCDGFVGNRITRPYILESVFLLEEGAMPAQIDKVLEDFGFPMGILKVQDLSGLDIGYVSRKKMANDNNFSTTETRFFKGERLCPLSNSLVEMGRLGRKSGAGWYSYDLSKQPNEDKNIKDIILDFSFKHNIVRRTISESEILERCLFAVINEAFKVLDERIASTPQDIDTICILGYGWPKYTGGPMFYADEYGLEKILEKVNYYYSQNPYSLHWRPAELLKRMSKSHVTRKDWSNFISSKI